MLELLLSLAPLALHEDDPKLLDLRPPYVGRGWRAGRSIEPGTPLEAAGPPIDFESDGVTLVAWLPLEEFAPNLANGNDCWGYVSPAGREYAILGTSGGAGFVDVSDPADPTVVGFVPGPASLWRDVKTYDEYAYVVSEGGDGIQVVDLSAIDSGSISLVATILDGPGPTATHNVAIDEVSGRLYRVGGGLEGLRIYDLSNPLAPAFLGSFDDRYVHDAQVVTYIEGPFAGRQLAFACSGFNGGIVETGLEVIDVTDPTAPVSLSRSFWPNPGFSHQCWLSEDRTTVYVNDELDEPQFGGNTRTLVFDVSDPVNPVFQGDFSGGSTAVGHNLYVRDDLIFEANYRNGLEVFDASAPNGPALVASFDTFPDDDAPQFNGLWSVYPFLPSGLVVGSDIEKGLFVWALADPELEWTFPQGLPDFASASGSTFVARLDELVPGSLDPSSVEVVVDTGAGAVTSTPVALGGGDYQIALPAVPCGDQLRLFLRAESTSGLPYVFPNPAQPLALDSLADAISLTTFTIEADDGWVSGAPGDTVTEAIWERGNPTGTTVNGQPFSPEDDTTPAGDSVWTTALPTDTFSGTSFAGGLSNGRVTLTTPDIDLDGLDVVRIAYQRWVSLINPNGQVGLTVEVSGDGGQSWTTVETVLGGSEAKGGWFRSEFQVDDFITPSDRVRVRFVAESSNGGLVDAAIDDLEVTDGICEPFSGAPVALSPGGGVQKLDLAAGEAFGLDLYLVLGSASGTSPATPVAGIELPLVIDAYTSATITLAGQGPFVGTVGQLDASGRAQASIDLSGGVPVALVGTELVHAYVTIEPTGALGLVSNPVPLALLP